MIDLLYLCDWLPPDFGAVGQYAIQSARDRASRGEHVVLYGLSSTGASTETEAFPNGSLRVERLKADLYDRSSFSERAAWTLKTNFALLRAAWRDARSSRELLITGSPPFLLHVAAPANLVLRRQLTYRISDFFPECWMAEYERAPLTLRLLHRLTMFWRRRVNRFEALGEDQRRRLVEAGIPPERIAITRDRSPVEISSSTKPLEHPAELRGYRILLYSGNFGVAHDHATFLAGYAKHHREGTGRVALWLNAIGRHADALEVSLKSAGLPHLRTRPVPLDRLANLLATADAHLITLRNPFWGYVLPSKVYGCIDSARPIIYVGPEESDVHLLSARNCKNYTRVDIGDANAMAHALEGI